MFSRSKDDLSPGAVGPGRTDCTGEFVQQKTGSLRCSQTKSDDEVKLKTAILSYLILSIHLSLSLSVSHVPVLRKDHRSHGSQKNSDHTHAT